MKTKISHFGRSSVSVILAVMMLLSTMLIGTVSTVNATVGDAIKVYFQKSSCIDNNKQSTSDWSNINAYAFDSNNNSVKVKTYTSSADSDGKDTWPGRAMNDEGNDIYSILVEPTATHIIFNKVDDNGNATNQTTDIALPVKDELNWKKTSVIYRGNAWESYSASVDTTGVVTDAKLISVLNGSKVMFYGGEAKNWEQTYFVAMNTQSTKDIADTANMTKIGKSLYQNTTTIDFQFGILCVPAGNYFMGHSGKQDWAPKLSANVVAGDAFVIYNKTINGFNEVAKDGGNLLLQSVSTGTKTATTTLSATKVATGDSLGVTTSTSAGSSSLGFDNTFEYYVHNKTTDKFYKVALSEGKLDTSAFTEEGEYEVKTVLKDTNGLYVLADSDNFVISNKAKYSVTFGSNDTNMGKVSVSDGTNSYTTSPASVEEGKEVTFTATANEGYKFDGWYSDAECKNQIDGASNATYTVNNISQAVSAYAKFSAVSYKINKEDVTNYSVVVNESAKYNSQVAVTVTATDDAYEVDGITVTDKDGKDVNVSGGESGVYTFTMPASNVTVKANSKLKQIDAPTVKFNVVGQSTADAKVLGSTPITASYTAAANSTIVEGSEKVVVTDAKGTTVSADKYSLVKNTTTGDYTFTAKEPGTYKLSYTVTAKSNYDENMTATNSPVSVTVTVAYTATQQAYVDLENYVNSVKDTNAVSYTEESFTAFSAALKSAKDLLKGLPNADASDAEKYTTALNNLTNAYKNLKSNKQYYILGHSAITGRTDNTSDEKSHNKGILMKDNGNGDYTYTFSSSDIKSGNDAFIFIDSSNSIYRCADSIRVDTINSLANSVEAIQDNTKNGMFYFGNYTGGTKKYTIHLNTATEGKYKVWVEVTFGLLGSGNIELLDGTKLSWDTYSDSASFTAENNYTLKFYANGNYVGDNGFRFIDSNLTSYGAGSDTKIDLTKTDAYATVKDNRNVYSIEKSDKPYTIRLTNPGENPPTFEVTQGVQHSVTVDSSNITHGSINVDKPNPYEGDTVTVTATPDSGYVLDTVTFNGKSAKVVGNKATFTMPNKDVTVTATFRKANKYKVTIASDITNGSVTANGSSKTVTVTEGTPVNLVANPASSYSFSYWSITPEDGYTSKDPMTSATATIYPTNNITVSASFTQGTVSENHFLALGVSDSIGDWTDGAKTYSSKDENDNDVYTAYLEPSRFKENTWYRFAVTKKSPTSDIRLGSSDLCDNNSKITVNGSTGSYEGDNVKTERKENNQNYFGMFQYSGELVSLSISYNEGTHNYQVTPVVKVHNGAKLYAKNGSCRTDNQYANNMHTKGTTTISYDSKKYDVDIDTKPTSWQIAYLSEENIKDEVKLTITTKVIDSENYYLAGWCVDGETYLPKTSDTENNEYSFDYYVKSTTKPNDIIEVTPVYFYRTSTDTETVRFYVTGFDDTVKKDWGNTIAVYPYYSGGTGDVFSNYPGQPMLVSGGRYYVDLPITYKGGTIAGVTLNNYFYDDVHNQNKTVASLGNRQTYDYNDFFKIYEQKIKGSTERKSQEIIFSFKYVPSDESGYNNFGDDSTGKGTKTYPATISANEMETVYKNGWEDLTDFYGNKVDLYNKKVEASSAAGKKNPWRVISNGYEQTYFGYYATRWAVYKPVEETGVVTRYSLVDVISSSSLLYNNYEDIFKDTKTYSAGDETLSASSDAEAYKAFTDAGADGVPVKITYEQTVKSNNSIEGEPNKNEDAYRNDGRWYYSEDNLDVTAHTVIEYADTLDGFSGTLGIDFRRDYYQKDEEGGVDYTKAGYDSSQYTGLETKTSAYFTNEDYYQKTEAKGRTGSDKTFDIIANTDHASQYIFVGWYLLSEGKYSPLTSTVENSVSVPQDNNDVYVARFIKAPSGSLTISHKLHPNTTGLGKCYVSVDVLDQTGSKVIHSYEEKTSDITVSNEYIKYGQHNKIRITLRTEPGEASSFIDFYSSDLVKLETTTGAVPAVTVTKKPADGTYKAEILFNVDDYLFDTDSADRPQKIKVLNYYSQLSLGEVNYEIKYTFTTRLYGKKVYKVSGKLTKEDIDTYGCTKTELSEQFVMAKAPFESNFKQNITWDSNQIKFGSEGGTLTAAITATQDNDRNVYATFYVDSDSQAVDSTTTFGNRFFKDGSYISANTTGTTYPAEGLPEEYKKTGDFSFWYVMTKNNNEFVTKAYGQNFAYTGYDNYIVVAVYGVDGTHKDEITNSSINFLQYSRNHWNDTVSGKDDTDTGSYNLAGTQYDRLYADFNLMFNHKGYLLNKYSGTPNIKVGYAMVVGSKTDDNYTVDKTELENAISVNATDGGTVEHQSESVTAKKAVSVTGSDNDDVKKNVIVNSIRIADLDNKNRITSYYGFKNSDANQSYYVKVYSYVIVDNKVTLSETPVVINLKDIGTMTY